MISQIYTHLQSPFIGHTIGGEKAKVDEIRIQVAVFIIDKYVRIPWQFFATYFFSWQNSRLTHNSEFIKHLHSYCGLGNLHWWHYDHHGPSTCYFAHSSYNDPEYIPDHPLLKDAKKFCSWQSKCPSDPWQTPDHPWLKDLTKTLKIGEKKKEGVVKAY